MAQHVFRTMYNDAAAFDGSRRLGLFESDSVEIAQCGRPVQGKNNRAADECASEWNDGSWGGGGGGEGGIGT